MKSDIYAREVFLSLWNAYAPWVKRNISPILMNDAEALEEFFFVILGGYGISYEENLSALEVLKGKGYTEYSLYINMNECDCVIERISVELSKPQFQPNKKDGGLRRYRFVNKKSKEFVRANCWLWKECHWKLVTKLNEFDGEGQRKWLCGCPGMGMKSASWLLRNIGINEDFAVLDIHLLRFLKRIGFDIPNRITEDRYRLIEQRMRNICQITGIPMGEMDYLLWMLGRQGLLDNVREI